MAVQLIIVLEKICEIGASMYRIILDCLSHLRTKKNDIHLGLSHDILIAISALSVGATLYTSNSKDFIRIQELLPVKTEYL
ncbi:MAG: hypothetical protein HY072_06115 [Deltaproteobacteria bacterium]|nr:hypothetical protein [Deltaproteobacteria bacterium]